MSSRFANILERELKAAALPSFAAFRGEAPAGRGAAPEAPPRDTSLFSARALNLSRSLRHYARDADRPAHSDPSLVTGWSEAGYLHDDGRGLSGEIRLVTEGGTSVSIRAAAGGELRVLAVRDGVEHAFGLDDFAGYRRERADPPALPPGGGR
jgi:hypothetical protein